MIANYYTLKALVDAWAPDLIGCVVEDAFSQVRDELTLALTGVETTWMLNLSVQAPLHFIFRNAGYSKARRNVATLFEDAFGKAVTGLRLAERDRMLYLDLEGGGGFQLMLFGSRANVFLTGPDGRVREAFQADTDWSGQPPPEAHPAPIVYTFEAFEARWRTNRKTVEQAVAAALPLFDRTLAAEAAHRAGITAENPAACTSADRAALFAAATLLREELSAPQPRLYWRDRFAEAFGLVPLQHLSDLREEAFDGVDDAVRVYVRRLLGQRRFRARYEPLEKALADAQAHHARAAEQMLEQLSNESRADRYERWGHLLMAALTTVPPAIDTVTLPDLFADNTPVEIPLDPLRSAVANAQRYYEKARQTRQARLYAEERMVETAHKADEARELLEALRALDTYAALEKFIKAEGERLAPYVKQDAGTADRLPFRRFPLDGGYEVWVGKNARQNDLLTFRYAQKYDLWMHARGVGGSHTVLRLPHRNAVPPRTVLERAAAIAAYYSKAKGSHLVPVIVTERKYVRKPKGAAPGAVVVEREDVLLVEPALP